VAELGNLTEGIFLPSGRMSTVKIRAGSLFHTLLARIGAREAAFGVRDLPLRWMRVFLDAPQE
jgi:hypothetical protein